MPRVVITLPAYRAERTLARTVAEIPPGVADRIILVDDASSDHTAEVARELGIEVHVHRINRGYGGNQKTCYTEALASGADIVVLLHPDYQYEPKAVPLLLAPILTGEADMTFGSRFAGLGDPIAGGMPTYRYVGNRLTTVAENLMLGARFTELHSGLRAYTRRCLLSLPFLRYSNGFVFDSQLLVDAITSGQRVVEVPIPTRYTNESSSIGIDSSLAYVAGSLAYCVRRVARRGRRGSRSPVVALPMRRADGLVNADGGCPACGEAMDGRRCTVCGLLTFPASTGGDGKAVFRATPRIAAAMLDAVAAYFTPGNRLLASADGGGVLATLALERGWEPVAADGTNHRPHWSPAYPVGGVDHDEVAVAVMLLDGARPLSDAASELRRTRSVLHSEGLLVVATEAADVDASGPSQYRLTPRSVHALLGRAGFELIEWIAAPSRARFRRSAADAPAGAIAVARAARGGHP